jgi:VWFA-related protein
MNICRRLGLTTVILVCSFMSSTSAQQASQSNDSLSHSQAVPSQESKVQVLVTIWDKAGQPVSSPPSDALLVQFDGKPVGVEGIHSVADEPLVFSVLLDLSRSTQEYAQQQVAAASKLFLALSRGNNHGFLVFFGDKVRTTDQVLDAQTAEQMLKQISRDSRTGSTALYDAIVHACTQQLGTTAIPPGSRRAIFVFSDGGDNVSRYSLVDTIKIAQSEGIPIFSVELSSEKAAEQKRGSKQGFMALTALSRDTGGLLTSMDDPHNVIGSLPNFLDGENLLTLKLTALSPKKSYSLKIVPSTKDFHVWAPTGYVAP